MQVRHLPRRHPIPVTCRSGRSLVLTREAQGPGPLVPPGLELDAYDGRGGSVVTAQVRARNPRPASLPARAGRDHAAAARG